MALTKEQIEQFEEAAKPLVKFMNELPHPHFTAVVSNTHAEISEGQATVIIDEFVKD